MILAWLCRFNSMEILFTLLMLLNRLKTAVVWVIRPHVSHIVLLSILKTLETISHPLNACKKRRVNARSEPNFATILCSENLLLFQIHQIVDKVLFLWNNAISIRHAHIYIVLFILMTHNISLHRLSSVNKYISV